VGQIEQKLETLGLRLPAPLIPVGNYRLVTIRGGLGYVAGHGPISGDEVILRGVIGEDLTLEEGYKAARLTALSILSSLKQELGDLDRVTGWLKVVGYIHCSPGFGQNAKVLDGFSDLIAELWGDAGGHARSAPGQGPSPLGVPVIVDAIVALD
jgi:enamine deaminase RidA (YjgF/YER057c/UK114 family)